MKALILSGGKGTRLRPLTHTTAKQLLPVANKPILWYGIEAIVAAGITEIGIIISPETGAEVQRQTGNGDRFGARITYMLQEQPAGLVDAVKVAQPFLADSPFLMYLGDNLIAESLRELAEKFQQQPLDALILLKTVTNPEDFGVAEVDDQGRVRNLVEKPAVPASNLALVGIYFFSPTIHQAIAAIQPSQRGELEITDALQWLLQGQYPVEAVQLQGWWVDTGKKDDLLDANDWMLDTHLRHNISGEVDAQSQIDGRVTIGAGSKIVNCHIQGPVIIGEDCRLENCWIGPYSSLGDRVTLKDVALEHSILLPKAQIMGLQQRLKDSVIGQRAQLKTAQDQTNTLRLMVGDDCQIEV